MFIQFYCLQSVYNEFEKLAAAELFWQPVLKPCLQQAENASALGIPLLSFVLVPGLLWAGRWAGRTPPRRSPVYSAWSRTRRRWTSSTPLLTVATNRDLSFVRRLFSNCCGDFISRSQDFSKIYLEAYDLKMTLFRVIETHLSNISMFP